MKRKNYKIRKGDHVMVVAGGNDKVRMLKGKVGKVLRFVGKNRDRAIVEGLNYMSHHVRATAPGKPSGKVPREAGIHISNLMYFVEKLKKPVRVRRSTLADGTRVRGYMNPEGKKKGEFVQIVNEDK